MNLQGSLFVAALLLAAPAQALDLVSADFCQTKTARDKCESILASGSSHNLSTLPKNAAGRVTVYYASTVNGAAGTAYAHVLERSGTCYGNTKGRLHDSAKVDAAMAGMLQTLVDGIPGALAVTATVKSTARGPSLTFRNGNSPALAASRPIW